MYTNKNCRSDISVGKRPKFKSFRKQIYEWSRLKNDRIPPVGWCYTSVSKFLLKNLQNEFFLVNQNAVELLFAKLCSVRYCLIAISCFKNSIGKYFFFFAN